MIDLFNTRKIGLFLMVILVLSISNIYAQKKEVFVPNNSKQIIYGKVTDEKGNPIIAQIQIWYYPMTTVVMNYGNSSVKGRTDNLICMSYTTNQGFYSVKVPADTLSVIITKGPEWSLVKQKFIVKKKEFDGIEFNVKLKRLYNLTQIGWYAGDEHHHSFFSDGHQSPSEVAHAMKGVGLSWGILTDHNSDAGTKEWLSNFSSNFIPIHGCEITTEPSDNSVKNGYGHLNQSFILKLNGKKVDDPNIWARARFDNDQDVQKMIDSTHKQNGFISINHPFQSWDWSGRFQSWGKVNRFNAIEVWNGEPPFSPTINQWDTNKVNINTWAVEAWFEYLNAGNKISGIAGSDCHDIYGVNAYPKGEYYWTTTTGNPRTYVHLKDFTSKAIKNSLKKGNLFLTSNFGPLLLLKVDNKIPGNVVKVSANGIVKINIDVLANQPLLKTNDGIKIIFNGKIVKELSTDTVLTISRTIQFETKKDGWILVEAFGRWPMYSITNPVYLDYPPYNNNSNNKFTNPEDSEKWNQFPNHPDIEVIDGPSSWRDCQDSQINVTNK